MKQQHGQTIVEIKHTAQNSFPFTAEEPVSRSSTARLKEGYPASPIHGGDLNDIERSGKFVENLASTETSNLKEVHPPPGKLSMQNAKAYWGFEYVNIKFGNFLPGGEVPSDYRPPKFGKFASMAPGLEASDMPPLGSYMPDVTISSFDVGQAKHPAQLPEQAGPLLVQYKKKWQDASLENRESPANATDKAQKRSIIVKGHTLGKYLLGKSSYTAAPAQGEKVGE